MNQLSNPSDVHKPLGSYSHCVKIPHDAQWLVMSGQVGLDAKGNVQLGIRKQAEQTFRNILAGLKANGMRKQDLVKFTVYLTDARYIGEYRAARKRLIGDKTLPTSTLVVVEALAMPEMLIEIEAWAART